MRIKECKYCKSNDIILQAKQGEEVLTADQVAIKCNKCKKWLGWCPKDERIKYSEDYVEEEQTEIPEIAPNDTQIEENTAVVEDLSQDNEKLDKSALIEPKTITEEKIDNTSKEKYNKSDKVETIDKVVPAKEMKSKVLAYLTEQRKIILGCFTLEKNKALSILQNITNFINNV